MLDGLVSAQASAASPQDYKGFLHNLQEIALATDCTMFLTTNVGKEAVTAEQTMVDGLIELRGHMYGWRSESDIQVASSGAARSCGDGTPTRSRRTASLSIRASRRCSPARPARTWPGPNAP